MESIKEFLRTLPLLSSLSDEEIELLARTCEERRFPAEAHILRKGEPRRLRLHPKGGCGRNAAREADRSAASTVEK